MVLNISIYYFSLFSILINSGYWHILKFLPEMSFYRWISISLYFYLYIFISEFNFNLSLKASFHHLPASLYFLAIILNKSIFQMLNKQLDDILIDLWNTIDYQSGTIWVMYSYNLMYTGPVFYLLSLSSIHSPLQNIKLLPGVWSLCDSHAISWPLKFISVILISRYIPLLCV